MFDVIALSPVFSFDHSAQLPPAYLGRLGAELTVEDGRKAAAIACLNVLSAARHHVGSLDKMSRVVRLGVSIATDGDFREHPNVADAASEMLVHVFGEEKLSTRIVALPVCRSGCRSSWK